MNTKMTATLAVAIVAVMVFAAAGATTYSWFSDSEETEITINTGSLDVSTSDFDVKHNGSSLVTDHGSIPGLISVQYDDGRSATTKWWTDSDRLTIAGNPANVNIEILYKVTFSGNIDYKYIIDVVCPEGINATVSVKDEGGNTVTYGSWKAPASEPTGPFTMTFDVSISITSIDEDVYGEKLKIVNMITQYNNPIDIWDGSTPASLPDTLKVDVTDKVISINDAKALAYLSTLNNNWDSSAYGSKWKYSIELNTNIDLNGLNWTPINLSNFVAFDGNGHTIYNLNVSAGDNAGLFASIICNDIGVTYVKDLNIVNAVVEGKECVGALVGNGKQAAVSNVVVDNAVLTGTKYVGGIFGWGNGSVNDCVVKNSNISVKYDGKKEAGGLIGYLTNDGLASTVDKVISGNLVENVTVFAPTVASGLVSQPNSINSGGAIIVIKDNTMIDVVVSTNDASASLFVSNNVSNKSSVVDNSAIGCQINHGFFVVEDPTNITVPKSEGTTDVNEANIAMPDFGKMVTISAQIVDDAPADFTVKLNGSESVIGGISVDIKDEDGNSIHDLTANPATVTMKVLGIYTSENLAVYHEDGTIVNGVTFTNDGTYTTITFNADKFSSYYAVQSPAFKIGDKYYSSLAKALEDIKTGETIDILRDCAVDVTVIQEDGMKITINGNGKTFAGVITVDGGSATILTSGLTIENIVFKAADGFTDSDACIRLGDGSNSTRYVCNVTVKGCTFDVPGEVGIKSYTGGDHNLTIIGCTATNKAHSLVQVDNVKGNGVVVKNCHVYSKNGLNFNHTAKVKVEGCTFDVKGYAVRFGDKGGDGTAEEYQIKDCTMKSACDEAGDAVIILRGAANNATLTIENTDITGAPGIITVSGAKVIVDEKDAISTIDDLNNACANDGNYILMNDLSVLNIASYAFIVENGKVITIDLNGKTIAGKGADDAKNKELFLVKGTLTFNGPGMLTFESTYNAGWGAMGTIFDITAGGILNLNEGVVVENLGGTDMTFGIHMNNWGEVTLNMDGATVKAPYCAIRVFNSGYDDNNVMIRNSILESKNVNMAFWVHNYIGDLDSTKHSEDAIKERLKFDIIDDSNDFTGKIRYGFSNGIVEYCAGTYLVDEGSNINNFTIVKGYSGSLSGNTLTVVKKTA